METFERLMQRRECGRKESLLIEGGDDHRQCHAANIVVQGGFAKLRDACKVRNRTESASLILGTGNGLTFGSV
jgi:hypothetical protein